MRGVCNELILVAPCCFHGLYRPPCKQDIDEQKHKKTCDPQHDAVACENGEELLLAGNVQKYNDLFLWGKETRKAQPVFGNDSGHVLGIQSSLYEFGNIRSI